MTFVPGFLPSTSALRFGNNWPHLPVLIIQTPFGPINIGDTAMGVCGGMCYVTCDLFEGKALPPLATSPPSTTDDPVYQFTVARFNDSLSAEAIETYYGLMNPALPDHETDLSQAGLAPHGRAWVMINQQWPRIKARIDSGHPCPIGLVLTKSLNPGDLGLNHVVVVFGYDLIGTDLTLHIYDPNFPNSNTRTIALSIADPLHTTTVTSNYPGLNCFFQLELYTPVAPPQFAAVFGATVPPSPLLAGHSYPVSITMKNLGVTTWASTGSNPQFLGSQNPENNTVWGMGRVNVPGLVPPGASATFNFTITAPITPGTRPFQWCMVQEGITWFGFSTPEIDLSVQLATMTASIQPCPVAIGQSRSYAVQVQDAVTFQPVNATIFVNGVAVGQSNTPFTYTFVMKSVATRDPETGRTIIEHIPPTMTAVAAGYRTVTVDLGLVASEGAAA
jgi:hypothetical protein